MQGAQHVRCACCHHITEVPRQPQPAAGPSSAPQAAQDMAQLTCTNPRCRVTLTYPRGASQVHCAMCGTLNDAAQANLLGHIVCGGCQITLSYAYGACSVKCAVCNHVTPVPGAPEPSAPRTQAVIVENPSSVDEAGFEIPNMALGVTSERSQRP